MLSNKRSKQVASRSYDFLFVSSSIPVYSNGYVLKHLNFLANELSNRGYVVGLKLAPLHSTKIAFEEFKKGKISLRTFAFVLINNFFFLTGLPLSFQRAYLVLLLIILNGNGTISLILL